MSNKKPSPEDKEKQSTAKAGKDKQPKEYGGYEDLGKPEPTRYGDWEDGGRCTDF